jgi:hypothetical protein
VLSSALGALTDHIDSKFLTAYWLPAFVAVLGGLGLLAALVGPAQMDAWVYGLDSVEQSLAALILLLLMTMLAFVLRALTRTIAEFFAGAILPQRVAEWSIQSQLAVKNATARMLGVKPADPSTLATVSQAAVTLDLAFPLDDAATKPTRLGNVLAAAADHPWLAYAMNGTLWWPRLTPLLPSEFQGMLAGALAPMMALLNLSVVFAALALAAVVVLGLLGAQWMTAIIILIVGFLLTWLCYRAAVSQATELGSMLRVAFDLYRYEILRQWNLDIPGDQTAERALWQRLTNELIGLPAQEPVA